MRRARIAVLLPIAAPIYAVAVYAGEPAGQESGASPPGSSSAAASSSAAPQTTAPPPEVTASTSAQTPAPPAIDPKLLAELQQAEGAEAVQRQRDTGTTASGESVSTTPAAPLGQEVVGNESNPAIALIVTGVGAWFSQDERIRQEGHSPRGTGPALQSAELAVQAPVDPFFRVFAAIGIGHMELEEAYAVTTSLPLNLKLRAGKFLADVGRQNATHMHQWRFASTPLPNEFLFGEEGLRLPGAELSVLLPLPWYVELIGAVQMGDSHSFAARPEDRGEPTYRDFVYPGRLLQFFDLSDDWALQLGMNTVQGRSSMGNRGADRTQAYGGDLLLKWRPIGQGATGYTYIATTVEGWHRKVQTQSETWRDAGGYVDITIGLDKEWDTGVRGELWRRLDDDKPDDIALADRLPFGVDVVRGNAQLSYMPSHFSRVRVQYTVEKAELFELNHVGMLQLEVAAGAHGAHSY